MTSIWWVDPVPDELRRGVSVRGTPSTRASMLAPKVSCSWVCLYRLFSTTLATASRLSTIDQALAGAAGGVVADVGDARRSCRRSTSSAIFSAQVVRVDLVRQLGDDQARCGPGVLLDLDDRAHRDRAAAGAVGVLDARAADDQRAGREVRALDPLDAAPRAAPRGRRPGARATTGRPSATSRRLCGGMLVAMPTAMPAEPLTSRFGNRAGQDRRLLGAAVVVGLEVDGLLVDVADHLHGQRRHPALGVPHARRPGRCPGEPKLPWPSTSG